MTHERDQEHTPGEEPLDGPDEVLTGPGGAGPGHGGLRGSWERRPVRARAVIAAATVSVLAVGGTVAYAAASDGPHGTSPAAASSPSSSTSPDGRGPWFGLRGGAVHGEETVKDGPSGTWVVRTWQSGTVVKADGDQVTVKSEDGAEWKWTVGSDTSVFRDGTSGSGAGTLKKGDTVHVTGRLADDGTRTAAQVFTGTVDDDGQGGLPGRGPWGRHHGGPMDEGRES
ncbi:DUF5666 domain-containing protein [Streptomyces sp. NBC_00285]|uniref:hypothetical protein n=1 Tax=Streptomyces sp. NBC_00285 TaxID=2975700 RepID=UPI002E2CB259|nr:hypothetical protein [Streptomyces sp. NBC_00285]